MLVGIITGSGTHALPDFEGAAPGRIDTPWGAADVTRGRLAGVDAVHLSRHGEGHVRLSNHVNHRANIAALKEAGCAAVVGCTACGAVDGDIPLGSLVMFDDLHFLTNRLADGSICSFHTEEGDPERGHWIYEGPFCEPLRGALVAGAREAGIEARDGGCYGHVDGPRFNTKSEIRALSAVGVTGVSQTAGPETVLAGEAGIPYALVGFATDYANGVAEADTPVDTLIELIGKSTEVFADTLRAAIPLIDESALEPTGTHYGFQ
jgi:purine nucleoside phosphorylase